MALDVPRDQPPQAHSSLRPGRLPLLLLPLLSVALAIWACGASPSFTHQPGSELALKIIIENQYGALDQPNVMIIVQLFTSSGLWVWPDAQAQITCDGVRITRPPNAPMPCPRQPPGGAYRITYTDGHGAATTATVPIPTGTLTLLSPSAGGRVPIPSNGALLIHFAVPVPPPGGTVSLENVEAWCSATAAYPCGSVDGDAVDFPTGYPSALATTEAATATAVTAALTTAIANRGEGTLQLVGDFQSFQPGPGTISLEEVAEGVLPNKGGFAAATAVFIDSLTIHVTWVR